MIHQVICCCFVFKKWYIFIRKNTSLSQQESTQIEALQLCCCKLIPSYPIPNCRGRNIIPSCSIDVKVIHVLSSVKVDIGFFFALLDKIRIPLISIWVRVNIEESHLILYPFNYGKESFYPLPWIGGHIKWIQVHILPSFHENSSSVLNYLALQVFRILIH